MKAFVMVLIALCAVAPRAPAQSTPAKSTPEPSVRPDASRQTQDVPQGQVRVTGQVHVGDTAPDFLAASSSGREVLLSHLKGDWIVLVFVENRQEFADLREAHEGLAEIGARIVGLCKEKAHRLRAYVENERLPFELLADDTGEISALYGYYSIERRATTHGFVVLDRHGTVRLALQGQVPAKQVEALARFIILSS